MKQQLKSDETQQALLASAFALFYEQGYKPTSIPQIVARAGLSKGAFYHHFADKQDLGEKTLNQVLRNRIQKGMIEPLQQVSSQGVVALLLEVFTRRIQNFTDEERRLGCPLNNLINELGCGEQVFQKSLKALIDEWKESLQNLLELGQEQGEIRSDVEPLSTATFLISAFEGARGIAKLYPNDQLLQEYLQGLKPYILQLRAQPNTH